MNKVKIEITGKNPDYLLKIIISKGINIYSLDKINNSIYLIINYDDYLNIKKIKTTYKIKIAERYGILKITEYLKRYKVLIVFLVIGILINIVLSNIIFKVEVIHPNKKLVNTITKDLEELGLKKYHFKIRNKELIKRKLLEKEKNKLEWLEIENIGTKYIIRIEEKKINKNKDKCNYRNIISNKDSIIIDIDASEGEVKKKINDYVSKGEVIISGFIYNKEDIVSKRCATGKVYGEVWYKVKVSIPKEYKKEELLNDTKYGININLFKKNKNKLRYYKKYEYIIIGRDIIPINISFNKYRKYKEIKIIYDLNNVDEIAINTAEKEIKKRLKKDEEVIDKKVLKKNEKNSKIEVEVFFKIKEDITSYQDISNVNIDNLNKKEE